MTKAEQLYCGKAGEEYWERNKNRLNSEQHLRGEALRGLVKGQRQKRWVEVGCGRGHNLWPRDIGVDIDARQIEQLVDPNTVGIIAPAYNIPLPDSSYPVVFSVGCLMHLPSSVTEIWDEDGRSYKEYDQTWMRATSEMARISQNYVIIGEYWADSEVEIEWHGEKGVLWTRPYTVPGFELVKKVTPLPPFDENITFGVFKKAK